MRSLDIKKIKKDILEPIVQPKKKKKQKQYFFNFRYSSTNYKNIYTILILILLIIIFVVFFTIFPIPTSSFTPENSIGNQSETIQNNTERDRITVYTDIDQKDNLDEIKNKLSQISKTINIVYRKEIADNIIYYGEDQSEKIVQITTIMQKDFQMKKSASADTAGIVIYYKK